MNEHEINTDMFGRCVVQFSCVSGKSYGGMIWQQDNSTRNMAKDRTEIVWVCLLEDGCEVMQPEGVLNRDVYNIKSLGSQQRAPPPH